jgi:hypothetical protein
VEPWSATKVRGHCVSRCEIDTRQESDVLRLDLCREGELVAESSMQQRLADQGLAPPVHAQQ